MTEMLIGLSRNSGIKEHLELQQKGFYSNHIELSTLKLDRPVLMHEKYSVLPILVYHMIVRCPPTSLTYNTKRLKVRQYK